ncbi:hypothetical protein [uncultured Chloroflexus sp.]|uniref:hypothetical protein n=1 Tax=uncultured Chloroflexus sp. TaxID=214040 RepID=UPI00262238A5|nr:hypothetical protein [uncultured Chloroflexus sp.]
MQRQWSNVVIIGLVAALAVTIAQAQPGIPGGAMLATNTGTAFTYQGRLSKDGAPVQGVCDFQFTLWDSASGDTALGTVTVNAVNVTGGLFTIPALDFGSNAFIGQARWLGVAVRCPTGSGSYTSLTPRQPLTAVPYALSLRPGAQIVGDVSDNSSIFAYNTTTSSLSYGIYGRSDSPNGRGVAGFASASSGDAVGVFGLTASSNGKGVTGEAWATNGPAIGVYGVTRSSSLDAAGVLGEATPTSVLSTSGMRGINRSSNATGFGVWGEHVDGGIGVFGTSGRGIGVYGKVLSNTLGLSIGVWGESPYSSGTGVLGQATATSGTTYGVRGEVVSPNGYAAHFAGGQGVRVIGNLQATGVKTFVIDHPLDPANKYLYHFAQEGPVIQNVYNGIVTLDATGAAIVTLPDYFAAINAEPFLYQLTPIGAAMPNLHVAQPITGNLFRIAGGVAGAQVSWEVTATRNDPYLRMHPVATEVVKPVTERGLYLAPEAYSLSPSLSSNQTLASPLPLDPTVEGQR